MMKKALFFGTLLCTILPIDAQTVFYESFNDFWSPSSNGWSRRDKNGNSTGWISYSGNPDFVNWGFDDGVAYDQGLTGEDNLLISPAINLPTGTTLSLSYKIASDSQTLPARHYAIYVLPSNATSVINQTPVLEETLTVAQAQVATNRSVDITGHAGQNVKIFIRCYNSPQLGALLLDDLKISKGTLGTSETIKNPQVGIYPNPTTDFLYLKSDSKIIKTEIFDMTGRKVINFLNNTQLDVRNLKTGDYLIKMETKNGVISQKFVKK